MAKVILINHTPEPVETLIFTKQTRLEMSPGLLDEVRGWTPERKAEELDYMSKTIRSSLEFVDFTFLIQGVSRAVAQQITRTRTASYAMQSQRVTDASSAEVVNPHKPGTEEHDDFEKYARYAVINYSMHKNRMGASLQDARGLLPMNITCNLVAKYNLRTLTDVCAQRESLRAQGEYADIARQFKELVLEQFPELRPFFAHPLDLAIKMIEDTAAELGIETGKGPGWELAKAADLLRKV